LVSSEPEAMQTTVWGDAPAQLFDDFKTHALGTFGVIGAHIDIDEGPRVFARDFRAEPVDFVVMALDADDRRAINKRIEDFALLQVRRNEDVGFEAGGGGVGGDGIGQIAGGGAGHGGETQFPARLKATLTTRSLKDKVG
jgi:hypothetical protein